MRTLTSKNPKKTPTLRKTGRAITNREREREREPIITWAEEKKLKNGAI
jgi:hypothetical protein